MFAHITLFCSIFVINCAIMSYNFSPILAKNLHIQTYVIFVTGFCSSCFLDVFEHWKNPAIFEQRIHVNRRRNDTFFTRFRLRNDLSERVDNL